MTLIEVLDLKQEVKIGITHHLFYVTFDGITKDAIKENGMLRLYSGPTFFTLSIAELDFTFDKHLNEYVAKHDDLTIFVY